MPKKTKKTKNTVSTYQHRLDWFLDTDPEDASNLTVLARKIAAEPFHEPSFRAELLGKLKRLNYWTKTKNKKLTWYQKPFYDVLTAAGVLEELLEPWTLRELWKSILLKKIVDRDRKLQQKQLAVDGQTLRSHQRQAKLLSKDLDSIREIADRNNTTSEAELYEDLDSKLWRRSKLLIPRTTRTYRTPHAELLSGRSLEELHRQPRDEDRAAKLATYQTLKWKLQTKEAEKSGVSNAFLYKLAELVLAPSDVQKLADAQIPYRDLKPLH